MKLREVVIEHIKEMEKEDLVLIYQIIKNIENTKQKQVLLRERGYTLVRKALSKLKRPLSKTIIEERALEICKHGGSLKYSKGYYCILSALCLWYNYFLRVWFP